MVHVVFCVNGIHVVSPLNPKKYRSISISSPCRFYFVLYCFIGFSWSPLPLFVPLRSVQSQRPLDVVNRSAQSRCPPDILWSSLRYGRCKADIHRMSCTLVFSLIRVLSCRWKAQNWIMECVRCVCIGSKWKNYKSCRLQMKGQNYVFLI